MKKQLLISFFLLLVSSFNYAANYYWVNGAGNWSDYSNHWATSSGATTFHTRIPTPVDDVYFDVNSFSSSTDSINFDTTFINCRSMIWTGSLPVTVYSSSVNTLTLYGSLVLTPGLRWRPMVYSTIEFELASQDSIVSAGDSLYTNIFLKDSGELILKDNLWIKYDLTTMAASLMTLGNTVTCRNFNMGTAAPTLIDLDTSTIHCYEWNAGTFINPFITISADSSKINCEFFKGGGKVDYNIVFARQDFRCSDSCSFKELICSDFFTTKSDFDYVRVQPTSMMASVTNFTSYNSIFKKVEFDVPNLELMGSNIFDSLQFRRGLIVNASNSSLTINSHIDLNGSCGSPTYFISPDTCKLIKASGTVDFANLQF